MRNEKLVKLVKMAMLAAIGTLLAATIQFPIIPGIQFLKYDPADIPILIGTFAFGPLAGLAITGIVATLQEMIAGTTGPIGILMHFLATGSFVMVAGLIYKTNKTKKGALIALAAGILTMTVSMIILNIIITPFYTGMSRQAVVAMLLPAIIPFNLIKAGANSIITFLLYKRIAKYLHK